MIPLYIVNVKETDWYIFCNRFHVEESNIFQYVVCKIVVLMKKQCSIFIPYISN